MTLASVCNTHTFAIERSPMAQDRAGGITKTGWAPVEGMEALRGTVQPMRTRVSIVFAQRQVMMTHFAFLPGNYTDRIKKSDRITLLDSDGNLTDKHFLVFGVYDMGGRGVGTKLECVEYQF